MDGAVADFSAQSSRNIRLDLAFDGSHFSGWQRQENARTVQGELEEALVKISGLRHVVHGAGRTDAGVHALGMVAHFSSGTRLDTSAFLRGMNAVLSPDVRVLAVREVDAAFHARRSALAKRYRYAVDCGRVQLPCRRLYALHAPGPLDLPRMRDCLALLEGEHDFSSFETAGSRDREREDGRGGWRRIFGARLHERLGGEGGLDCEFLGDGFLRHMVRAIVGTLLAVGRGRRTVAAFAEVLAARDRRLAGQTAPAHGLWLVEVLYPGDLVVPAGADTLAAVCSAPGRGQTSV